MKDFKVDEAKPCILYIDTAYTMTMVYDRKLEQELNSRECGGYFEHIWATHPFADIPEMRPLLFEGFKVAEFKFSGKQTILEGQSAYYKFLKYLFPVNFLFSQIRFIRYLVTLVKSNNILIIFATDPYFSGLIGLIIKKITKTKLIIWVCGNNDEVFEATGVIANPRLLKRRWVEKIIEKTVFKSADLVAGTNQNNLNFALSNGASLKKSTIFPTGKLIHLAHLADPQLRPKDEVFTGNSAKYNFIFIGRMTDIKHPDDVLRAFSYVCNAEASCSLIMVGSGDMLPELEELANELKIKEKVFFLKNQDQIRLASILSGCFAAFSPLTGRSLIEATLAGLPVIAYDRDWQAEYLLRLGAGTIIEFRDWEAMGKEALKLIENPALAQKYAEASRQTGLEYCDTDKIYAHEQAEFDKLLKKGS